MPATQHIHPSFFGKIKHRWNEFDNRVIKPLLLNNWPQSGIDHEEISNQIKRLFHDFYKTKSKYLKDIKQVEEDDDDDYDNDDRAIGNPDVLIKLDEIKLDEDDKYK